MKFKRISADTVRCFISSEELAANGLTVADFMNSDGRCEEFIRKVVTLAQEEVDFKVYGGPMSIQVAALSEGTIALTFSERQDMGITEFLEALKSAVEKIKLQGAALPVSQDTDHADPSVVEYMFYADSMDDILDLVRRLPGEVIPEASIYRASGGGYYIVVREGGDRPVTDFISRAIEFIRAVTDEDMKISYVKEHMKCVLKQDALGKLAKLL